MPQQGIPASSFRSLKAMPLFSSVAATSPQEGLLPNRMARAALPCRGAHGAVQHSRVTARNDVFHPENIKTNVNACPIVKADGSTDRAQLHATRAFFTKKSTNTTVPLITQLCEAN